MASTTFTDGSTVIRASWLNDVNTAVYTGVFPNASLTTTSLIWGGYAIPTPTGSTTTFLRNDGTWATPGGSGIGTVTSITFTSGQLTGGTITSSGTVGLATTAVTAGSYTSANITVDAYGRITSATNGSGSSATLQTVTNAGNSTTLNATFASVGIGYNIGTGWYGIATNNTVIGLQNTASGTPNTIVLNGTNFVSASDNSIALGTSAYRYSSLAVAGNFYWGSSNISAPAGSTSTFLRNDGTWASPSSSGVSSFNSRTGAVTLSSSDVTTALGYTPLSSVPSLQQVCTVGASYSGSISTTSNSTFGNVNVGVYLSSYYGIGTAQSTIGISNSSGSNMVILQSSNFVPVSANAINLGTSSLPWASLAVSGSAYFGTASSWSQTISVYGTIGSSGVAVGAYASGTSSNALASVVASTSSNLAYFGYGSPSSPTTVGTISTNGSSTTYGTSSDRRLKSNISALPAGTGIEKIKALLPRTFSWNATGTPDIGFIADELQAVVANAVHGQPNAVDADGKPVYQSVDNSFIMPYLVQAVQELIAKVGA
jgi:hypothetical protein